MDRKELIKEVIERGRIKLAHRYERQSSFVASIMGYIVFYAQDIKTNEEGKINNFETLYSWAKNKAEEIAYGIVYGIIQEIKREGS